MIYSYLIEGAVARVTVSYGDSTEDVLVDADKVKYIVRSYPNLRVKDFKSGTGNHTVNKYACYYEKNGARMLHRELVNAPKGMLVSFRDKNSLNCTSSNLMKISASEHSATNFSTPIDKRKTATGYIGVRPYKNKFRAYIKVKKKQVNLGLFDTIDEALKAREQAEIKYWGEPIVRVRGVEDDK